MDSPSPNYANVLAQKAIQQITEPLPTIEPLLMARDPPISPEPINFVQEIQSMLYSFGDSRRPKLETAILVDDIVRQQMVEILLRALDASHLRANEGVVGIEEVLFLLRKNPVKVQRFVKYFKIKDMAQSMDNKRAKRCRDFLLSIDNEGGLLTQALNEEIHDEVRLNRNKRRDRYTRNLDERKFAEFIRARHYSFLGYNTRFTSKFRDWVLREDFLNHEDQVKLDKSGLEALAYLAYETVGYITEMALLVRHDSNAENKVDLVQRCMAPVSYNTQYPMIQMPLNSNEDNARRMLNKEDDLVFAEPLEPHHVLEAVRRLTQRPTSALGWHRRLEPRNRPNPMPIIAI